MHKYLRHSSLCFLFKSYFLLITLKTKLDVVKKKKNENESKSKLNNFSKVNASINCASKSTKWKVRSAVLDRVVEI